MANISKNDKTILKTDNPEIAKIFTDCIQKAKSETNACIYPECTNKSINSHIMQKNGILSSIAEDKHLWELKIDTFQKEHIGFKKNGINKIYPRLRRYVNATIADLQSVPATTGNIKSYT